MMKGNGLVAGIASGLVVTALLAGREPVAQAAPAQGVDNQGKYTLAVGGSEPNRYDMLWVLHEHLPHPKLRPRADDGFTKPEQITICLYKIDKQGEEMRLIAARDIAYDIELRDLRQGSPTMKEVHKTIKDLADARK